MNIIPNTSYGCSHLTTCWMQTPVWARSGTSDKRLMNRMKRQVRMLTKQTGNQWSRDHIIPLRGEFVSGLHCIENLVLMPVTDNRAKSNTFNC
jgi:hypothetical protein